jgi:L-fuculose-phosphate aldolase
VEKLRGQEELMHQSAAAVLMPQHGIILAGIKIMDVLDSLERIDTNAYCLITQSLLPASFNPDLATTGNNKPADSYAE